MSLLEKKGLILRGDPEGKAYRAPLTLTEDGRVLLTLDSMAQLTKGKSYTLYLEVTPVNNAENVVPTQVKVNIKVSK
jgi:hypothetical protein